MYLTGPFSHKEYSSFKINTHEISFFLKIWGRLVTFLENSRHAGMFYNKKWISLLKVFLKYYCALIAQIEESGFKERNQRNQCLDTPFQQNKYLWLAG